MLGPVFRKLRQQLNVSQQEIAQGAGISQAAVSQIENDPDYSPSWSTVVALARVYCLSLDKLRAMEQKEGKQTAKKAK